MPHERVTKIMSSRGLCSRREAERLIERGQVVLEGVVVREQGVKAPADAEIRLLPEGKAALASLLTVVLHKPPGVVSANPDRQQTEAAALLRSDNAAGPIEEETLARVAGNPKAFSVAGRLDRDSRGLLVLTEDGAIAKRLIGTQSVHKLYRVGVAERVSDAQLRKLNGELHLDGKPLRPMKVTRRSTSVLQFDLTEGRNRQIRRVCRHVGLDVVDLLRVAVGPLRLGDLPEGRWRLATSVELSRLRGTSE